MMGRAHSLSGAAVWLGGTAAYTLITGKPIEPSIIVMGAAVFPGAALGPDLDSYTATVTKSFGIFGRIFYYMANAISILMYNLTKTRKDDDITNGHRTFMHTAVASALIGFAVFGLTGLPGETQILGEQIPISELAAIIIMAFFLHLAVAGLFAPQIKKAKKTYGPYLLMVGSLITTFLLAKLLFIPSPVENYHWLAWVVGVGWFTHIMGDTITKMGTPFLWPLKIRGKRWYDMALPSALRITAGGAFELKILTPLFIAVIAAGIGVHIWLAISSM